MDKVFAGFLQRQWEEGMTLAAQSDLLELRPGDGSPPRDYLAQFRCKGLVRLNGEVVEAERFVVAIRFPDDYLRRVDPAQVVLWLGPREVFHPNVSDRGPFICLGRMTPGASLIDLLFQVFEIITYNKATMREDDALNVDACVWARNNAQRLPVDRRPLKRRAVEFAIADAEEEV